MKTQIKQLAGPVAQKGVILIITLIAMVALAIASIALLRGVDAGNVISGNMAFRQATLQAGDIGVEAAFNALPNITAASLDANIANQYYATRQTVDSGGVPIGVNWATVPCRNSAGATVVCSAQAYQVKYVIDRLCDPTVPLPITNVSGNCYTQKLAGTSQGGSKKAGAVIFSTDDAIYYRITVQVSGPRNTQSYVQAIVNRS
ncbi:hypothetical protein [Accumulibacter sp.]|uniref:pilus assembly PilX family protein n=1 Tax=Accumulibacter sp. TaxID=2053492 RepID=UPI0028C4BEDD|nr:hypothetical protein [Accumulibacter sp.]